MTISAVIKRREIPEVLHFTTNLGLLGMLAGEKGVLSRQRLPDEKYLEHVYRPNAAVRRDGPWLDYVNLSISHINTEFFGHSERWHEDEAVWWCIVALDPEVLTHDGVLFATTNNMYTSCNRCAGETGLENLFAERVTLWPGNTIKRDEGLALCETTCHQAEVLYPQRVLLEHFRHIYVATPRHADIVGSQSEILHPTPAGPAEASELPIYIRPDAFEPR
jgi:hypothetical protein